jgi:hypothetical protein
MARAPSPRTLDRVRKGIQGTLKDKENRKRIASGAWRVAVEVAPGAFRRGRDRLERRNDRARALAQARQYEGGRYSEGFLVNNRERYVVWRDGKAVAVYPPLHSHELNGRPLHEHPELQSPAESVLLDPERTSEDGGK